MLVYHSSRKLKRRISSGGNIGLRGGIASVTTYDKDLLLEAVLREEIHPGKVFTQRFNLNDIQSAYEAMDQRQAIKSLIVISQQ